jgi:uncharacterized repeat protein (TIGR01451 family)
MLSRRASLSTLGLAVTLAMAWLVGPLPGARAATPEPSWRVDSYAYPTNFSSADNAGCNFSLEAVESNCDIYTAIVTNVGAKQSTGAVTIEDTLPAGVTARNVSLLWSGLGNVPNRRESENLGETFCTLTPLRCKLPALFFSENHKAGASPGVQPDETLKLWVSVTVNEGATEGPITNIVKVTGGGAAEASASNQNAIAGAAPAFGFYAFTSSLLGADGTEDTQAGDHPYELATQINLNSTIRNTPEGTVAATTVRDVRDVIVDLPLGLAGSAVSAPTCTLHQLSSRGASGEQGVSGCPTDTIIGHIRTYPTGFLSVNSPIYNIVPEHGVAGEFGFIDNAEGTHVLYASLAPTPAGYVLRTTTRELAQVPLDQISVDIYGDPAARDGSGAAAVPTFTNPEDCSGEPLETAIHMDSWASPGAYNADGSPDFADPNWATSSTAGPPVTGCAALAGTFNPSIEVHTSSTQANSPTGLDVTVNVPQSEGDETLGTPPLRNAVVTLPPGLDVNPSSANGLEACSLAQIGMSVAGTPNAAAPDCPDGSKIGTLELETPALASETCKEAGKGLSECPGEAARVKVPLQGTIYLAKQGENPFGTLLALYLVVDDSRTGVLVKLPAEVKADASSGQLTTVVRDSPQFPFSRLRTHFFEGPTAALQTPAACGAYSVTSELTPWSAPESGPAATPTGAFDVAEGPGGGSCSGASDFAPTLSAGTVDSQASAFTPFSVTLSRGDADQVFGAISLTTPPGLLGTLKNVAECPEPQAANGDCGADSLLGEATTAVGSGPDPFWVHGGKVFLTGPYNGGPFGLSIVVPTTAGPFTLTGNGGVGREIVRASIRVDPRTAQITVLSDPLPTILEGIPLDIRTVNVVINRPGFMFNPTNCSQLAVSARVTSTGGAGAAPSTPFQAAGCAGLPFAPKLTAITGAKGSKANGASLDVKITSDGLGQANIAKVDLQLPKALPSRLTTIQKACLAQVFEQNPAACDEGSVIGTGTVLTPVLKSPLTGPAYLVSHGGAAFPDVEFVLQGEGVTLVLDGTTDIKKGITYSRFDSTPDAPFTSFDANLPTGPHSAFTANVPEKENYSLCKASLAMPVTIVAQNGRMLTQTTKIAPSGCAKANVATRAQKLAMALKKCRKDRKRNVRLKCEKQARKKYGPTKVKSKKKVASKRTRK